MSSPANYHTAASGAAGAMRRVMSALDDNPALAVCLDFEWDSHAAGLPLQLVQVAVEGFGVHVFDANLVRNVLSLSDLSSVMQYPPVVKVLHDARADTFTLRRNMGSEGFAFASLFDTQTAHWVLTGEPNGSLVRVVNHWLGVGMKKGTKVVMEFMRTPGRWSSRPLPQDIIKYAEDDVAHLPMLYAKQKAEAESRGLLVEIMTRSELRAKGLAAEIAVHDETALAFKSHLESHDELGGGMDKDSMRRMLTDWKAAELAQGRYRHLSGRKGGTFHNLIRSLQSAGFCLKGHLVAFSAPGTPREVRAELLLAVARRVESSRAQIEADKRGVVVSAVSFPGSVRPYETAECLLEVRNQGPGFATLRAAKLLRNTTGYSQMLAVPLPAVLPPGAMVTLRLQCTPRTVGMCYDTLSMTFCEHPQEEADIRDDRSVSSFTIGRFLKLSCGDLDLLNDLRPTAPYQRKKRKPRRPEETSEEIQPPSSGDDGSSRPEFKMLQHYNIPSNWQRRKFDGSLAIELEELRARIDAATPKEALAMYAGYYQRLLWTEELQLHADLSAFDLVEENATTLAPRNSLLAVHVRGLAEKRPSVLKGDILKVNRLNDRSRVWVGRAEHIEMEDVLLRFDQRFAAGYVRREKVEVRFVMGRGPLRVFHQGLTHAPQLRAHILFPPNSLAAVRLAPPRPLDFHFVNAHIANNPAQRDAVRRVVEGKAREVPYVIFGPPGTGKTTTVVEMVLQCMQLRSSSRSGAVGGLFRILVCAPTNTAADLLCSRLGVDRLRMLRYMAYSRAKKEVPEAVLRCSNWSEREGAFSQPALDEIMKKSVVVATLSTAGKLTNCGVPHGHFDLIVIDEAGQAQEPEATAPVCMLLGRGGQLVLAGDPKQLGPVIHSAPANAHGLAMSLLERLMDRPLYQPDPESDCYNPLVLTKLVQNFRSHEVLLRVPNQLFYRNELQCCADVALRNYCCGPEYAEEPLATRALPLLFYGVEGTDMREGNSPSWFNAHECTVVLDYVKALLHVRGKPLAPEDIGVITPYNKQAQKIQRLLMAADLPCSGGKGIKVGSTELFQGQERKVIIISTVRSSANQIGFDVKHNLGFLQNPKRFNVATTRACALMILVGNPHVLVTDPHWGTLLRECIRLGAYRGVTPPTAASGVGGNSGDGSQANGDGDDANDLAADRLAEDLEELMLDASERVQQEGMEMPTWG